MKLNKSILSMSVALLSSVGVMAQTGAASGTPFGSGADSVRCLQNISIFSSYAKAQNFDDAFEPWQLAYKECPGSSKNIYIHGANILKHKISKETNPAKRAALINDLLALYDNRIKFFGEDAKKGKDAITLDKVNDYLALTGDKADYSKVYDWTKHIVEEYKENSPANLLYWFLSSSREVARKDASKKEAYLNDYLAASDYLDTQLNALTDSTARANLEINIAQLDESFARSGLASCDLLKKIYTMDKIEERKTDKNFLASTIKIFQNSVDRDDEGNPVGECDSPVPDKAAEYLFRLEPSANAAKSLAGKYVREKNYNEAIKYIEEAIKLSSNNNDKVKAYELLWGIAGKTGNGALATRAQNAILAINPNNGRILIQQAVRIGNSANSIFPGDPVKARCVFFLVIQRLQAAAAKDSSIAAQANRLIGQYRARLPKAADIFMHPELGSGKALAIPGYGSVVLP